MEYNYSGYQLSQIQKPHPQPPPRKRGGGYDVLDLSGYRYTSCTIIHDVSLVEQAILLFWQGQKPTP